MCVIWAYISKTTKKNYYDYFNKIAHRGPDTSVYMNYKEAAVGFHRLAIINKNIKAMQPFIDNNLILICNGEIYNYKEIAFKYNVECISDCMVLLQLYKITGEIEFSRILKNEIVGEFAFVILNFDSENKKLQKIIAGRDTFGVRPLFHAKNGDDEYVFSSELKGIPSDFKEVFEFPCGSVVSYDVYNNTQNTYDITNDIYNTQPNEEYDLSLIKDTLIEAVKKRLMADDIDDIGFYLSGGLDSSIICSIASKLVYPKRIKTFTVGFENSTDVPYAAKVAKFINSIHKEIIINENDALDAIDNVIYATDTYDITTIRASCGQYLLSKYIKENTNIKIIMNGDGSDEVLGGYIFNYYAPDAETFHESCIKYTKNIHMYDARRLDRTLACFGLEARVPYLDTKFVKNFWQIPKEMRMPTYNDCEKFLLRQAFNDNYYLPEDCLFRKKEALSDGISSKEKSWFSIINEKMNKIEINDDDLIGPSKEADYYKRKFIEYFGEDRLNIIPGYWQPDFISNNVYIDPSARVLKIY